jgi:hypothetical protein
MKVLAKGRPQKGWSKECNCLGSGNGGGGCNALLLVEQGDLFITQSHCMNETETYVTFKCSECGVLTDLKDVPYSIQSNLPTQAEWMAAQK